MIHLGAQYYRPPFPESKYWNEDLRRMKDSGLNTLQLWVLWAWVEAQPGIFQFDDYDRLMELADRCGLEVVLSTIAEVQPLWIHREVPDSEMVTRTGQRVISGARNECHFGLTPGGCTDHPEVWRRMATFLAAVAERYRDASNLFGWDVWNELRWNVHADDRVCFCPHTLRLFREWLARRFGDLDGLNRAWNRRYDSWESVRPAKRSGGPFTENMAFSHFLTWRACEHGRNRFAVIKAVDPRRPVTLHGGAPSAEYAGGPTEQPLNRGNDWFFADTLDGVGTSSFPKWSGIDDADFGIRMEMVASAARGKRVWLSELQGGRAARGFESHVPADARSQQRWIWNGLACGADTILFWCWRDEVFCSEASGFGLAGFDGHADERLDALRITGRILADHEDLLSGYRPSPPVAGILFSPQTFYHHDACEGHARRAYAALMGYARALVRQSIPLRIVEEEHLETLEGLKILFLPRVTATSTALEEALITFVRSGGTLVCESECGAFTPEGFYRYPEDRFTARLAGRAEVGRRGLPAGPVAVRIGGETLELAAAQWTTPWNPGPGTPLACGPHGDLVADVPAGDGRLLLCGTYFGEEYYRQQHAANGDEGPRRSGFERLVAILTRQSGWRPEWEASDGEHALPYVKSGRSNGRRLFFVFFPEGQGSARLQAAAETVGCGRFTDLLTGTSLAASSAEDGTWRLDIPATDWRFCVLAEDESPAQN